MKILLNIFNNIITVILSILLYTWYFILLISLGIIAIIALIGILIFGTIIEKILSPYLNSGKIRCDLEIVEKEILESHLPIEKCLKFLCHSCHVAYDSTEKHTKITRIKLWANRPHQDNHKIIEAFLLLEKSGDVQLSQLKDLCSNKANSQYFVEKFGGHYASMKTDKGNSHGKVFYDQNGLVFIWPLVREEIRIHFKNG